MLVYRGGSANMVKWLCMSKKPLFIHVLKKIQQLPLGTTLSIVALILVATFYSFAFLLEKPVAFSYEGPTCTDKLTLFPSMHRIAGETDFAVRTSDEFKVGGVVLAASSVCFTPKHAPQTGTAKVSTAPFGGWFAKKTYALAVTSPVAAHIDKLTRPVPISRPLTVELSSTDKIFSYVLKMGEKQAPCKPLDAKLSCEVNTLDLVQGQTYQAELLRQFKGKAVASVAKKELTTLSATHITESSIKQSETVYSKPSTIDLVFDKKLVKATPALYRIEGEKRTEVETDKTLTDTGLRITIPTELPRSGDYELVTDGVEATDGSSLEEAHVLAFKTSGGPKVTGVSVGRTGIPIGATAVISFDQPLSDKQDVSKIITLTGGATLAGKRGNQLLISLGGVPKCGDFTVKITNDLQSNYDIAGNSVWSFTGRTICHTVVTIGYSSKGRAINAYYFGNGDRAVLYTGAIHGNELSTRSLMNRWIDDLEANARNIPADKLIVVVPQINPDGVSSGSRVNARNVDLNRNFDTSDWQKDITDVNNQPFPGGGGESPMSEPETRAIAALASQLRPIVVLSYHSIAGVVAANQAGASSTYAGTYSQLSGYRNVTGQAGDTFKYSVSGMADDWYAEELGVASLLIELSSHSYHQFERNQKAMWTMVNL